VDMALLSCWVAVLLHTTSTALQQKPYRKMHGQLLVCWHLPSRHAMYQC
jgi:hypothetical protein